MAFAADDDTRASNERGRDGGGEGGATGESSVAVVVREDIEDLRLEAKRAHIAMTEKVDGLRAELTREIEALRSQASLLSEEIATIRSKSSEEIKELRAIVDQEDEMGLDRSSALAASQTEEAFARENEGSEPRMHTSRHRKNQAPDFQRTLLPRDTFSFFVFGKPTSVICAVVVLVSQALTFFFLLQSILDLDDFDNENNPFGLPPDVSGGVRACQVLALLITVLSEDNIITSISALGFGFEEEALREKSESAAEFVRFWFFSNVLRLLEGTLAVTAIFVLIVQSETARDVLLTFTAVQFVSFLDDAVFILGGLGYLGLEIQKDVKRIEQTTSTKEKKQRLWWILPVIILIVLSLWLSLSFKQGRGDFLCQNLLVQFGDEIVPDLAPFSGVYERVQQTQFSSRWGKTVEYRELGHVQPQITALGYEPAVFGYVSSEGAWVFSRGVSASSKPDLSQWRARSSRTASFDITKTASSTWFVKKDSDLEVPLDYFHLSCYDCKHHDSCGPGGQCVDNQCVCADGRFGLRCEFTPPCETLVKDVRSDGFPAGENPVLPGFEWPRIYERVSGLTVYNRPVYTGETSVEVFTPAEEEDSEELTEETLVRDIAVIVFFTGRRWSMISSLDVNVNIRSTTELEVFFSKGFHVFWSSFTNEFVSTPSDIDTATDAATPLNLNWLNSRGTFLAIESVLVCRGSFTDRTLRAAVAERRNSGEGTNYAEILHGYIGNWDTSRVVDMSGLFANDLSNSNISFWDTSSVTDTTGMFLNATAFNQDLSAWNLSKVGEMTAMFYGATSFNENVSSWDTSAVTDMNFLFADALEFNQEVSGWNTTSVISMVGMFAVTRAFNQDLSKWRCTSVSDVSYMFFEAVSFDQRLSAWDTSSVTNMRAMFHKAESFNQDLSTWDTSLVTDMYFMFDTASSFNGNVSTWDTASVTNMGSMFFNATAFNHDVSKWDTSAVSRMDGMFSNAVLFNSDISMWDTSQVTDMDAMFRTAHSFNQSLSEWNTSSATRMNVMFSFATSFNQDISRWNTSLVEEMAGMFWGALVFNQDLPFWDTSSVWNMNGMFANCTSFNGNISTWDTSAVVDMFAMFFNAPAFNQQLSRWNTSSVTTMTSMFGFATLFNQDLSHWDTSSVGDMSLMFRAATAFNSDLTSWDTSAVKNMRGMFAGATSFNRDVSTWDISSVTDMSFMFLFAANFNQTLCWTLNEGVNTTGMFCGSQGSFDPTCVDEKFVNSSQQCP